MKTIALFILAIALAGCTQQETATCPGYERTNVGSGCRHIESGTFVDSVKCDC